MSCPACNHQNLPNAKFCVECGSTLNAGCSHCGAELTANAKFCHECGTPVAGAAPARPAEPGGARKVVSILFADLAGSTAMQERLDPESTRRFMESYYQVAREAVESHGGTVTQFLGDGVLAMFGIPQVAEDDAIRAVRAGVAMQEAFQALAEKQRAAIGTTAGLRVAINTGEVVAKSGTEIIGDPVNVAARLQDRGNNGDVVIGEATQRLVATQVTLELLGSFDLKGRSKAVEAYRVISLEPPQQSKLAPFVGRTKELARITAVYDHAVATPTAKMAVLLGSAGLGKSRLIAEFSRRSEASASVIYAHCDAAGGASFAPIADALRKHLELAADASTETMQAAIDAVLQNDEEPARIARGVLAILSGTPGAPEETFFVIRRFLAALTTTQPVVLIVDDLQWAEPLLFDLVEHLVQWGQDLPLFLLIGARPELREIRSAFGKTAGFVSDVLTLQGLDANAAMKLAAGVIGAADLPSAVAAKVLATSEGNPLFISELIRMLVVEGALIFEDDEWLVGEKLASVEMPPTIHALLASRIERLEPLDCSILERAAVVGRQFSRSSVAALLPDAADKIDARLEALQSAELIERGTGWFLGEPVLRFHHVLIRDAAYRRLLKGSRAELHEQLANWIEDKVGDAQEHDETIGRHLEDAHRLLSELGPLDEAGEKIGERAANHLAPAGRRALEADDVPLAANLLGRALARMQADHPDRPDLCLDWCESLLAEGEVSTAQQAIDELGRLKEDSERLQAWHDCFVGQHTVLTAPRELTATVTSVSAAAQKLAALQDSTGEAKAHYVHALALSRQGQIGACEAALDQALAAARKANDRRQANTVLAIAPIAALWGPSPVTRASGRCLDVVRVLRITQGAPAVEAVALMCQGVLEALRGRSEAAHRMIESGREMVEELGIAPQLRNADAFTGYVHLLEGDLTTAETKLRSAYEGLRDLGLGIDAARAAALLAKTLLSKGEIEEAKTLSHESEQLAGDDLKAAIAWRGVRAEALAKGGEHEDAIKLARKAVKIAEKTDALLDHADARHALAVALREAGQTQEASAEEKRAQRLWEDKGATLLLSEQQPIEAPSSSKPTTEGNAGKDAFKIIYRPGVQNDHTEEFGKRFNAAMAARDYAKLRSCYSDDFNETDHSTGLSWGPDGSVASLKRLVESEKPYYHQEVLANLGRGLELVTRRFGASAATGKRFDVGQYEGTRHQVHEILNGHLEFTESFGEEKLGDAVACLYERYAESLPEGPERQRASNLTGFLVNVNGAVDFDAFITSLAPDVNVIDHRTVGFGEIKGAQAVAEAVSVLMKDLTEGYMGGIADVRGLRPNALLFLATSTGTDRASGGTWERSVWELCLFDSEGRIEHWERFDEDKGDEAFARFHELTGSTADNAVKEEVQRFTHRLRPGVSPNAATREGSIWISAVAANDISLLEQHLKESFKEIDHSKGTSWGRDGNLKSTQRLLQSDEAYFHWEDIASLGPNLALSKQRFGASGAKGKSFDVGPYEVVRYQICETDSEGIISSCEVFDENKLTDAMSRLYERYAESLPDGPERQTALSISAWTKFGQMMDLDAMRPLMASDFQYVDHRHAGLGTVDTADAFIHAASVVRDELADNLRARFDDVLCILPNAFLIYYVDSGTDKRSGGEFERHAWDIYLYNDDGLACYMERFEPEHRDAAIARFEELTGSRLTTAALKEAPRFTYRMRPGVHPNHMTTSNANWVAALAAGNPEREQNALHEDIHELDHATGSDWGREGIVDSAWRLIHSREPFYQVEALATLGSTLALSTRCYGASGGRSRKYDVGAYEIVRHEVMEGGEDGIRRMESFAEDRLTDAISRLYERYAESLPDGPERQTALNISAVIKFVQVMDLEAIRPLMTPDFRYVDHRHAGLGTLDTADAFIHAVSVVKDELADNLRARIDDVLRILPNAFLIYYVDSGTDKRSGGEFERHALDICVFNDAGLYCYFERFEPEHKDQALARFEELTGGGHPSSIPQEKIGITLRPGVKPNANTTFMEGFIAALKQRDFAWFRRFVTEDYREIDHKTGSTIDKAGTIASLERLFRSEDPYYQVEELATLGESLDLGRHVIGASSASSKNFDVGAYENVRIQINHVGGCEVFGDNQLGDALARLYERYAESLPEGPERKTASAISTFIKLGLVWNLKEAVALLAPDIRYVDHRHAGVGELNSPDALINIGKVLKEDLTNNLQVRIEDVLRIQPNAFLWYYVDSGTDKRSGGDFERHVWDVIVFNDGGLVSHWDRFEHEHKDRALARFEELTSSEPTAVATPAAPGRKPPRNIASDVLASFEEKVSTQDWEAVRGFYSDDYQAIDHPTGKTYGADGTLSTLQLLFRSEGAYFQTKPIAALGEHLCLCQRISGGSGVNSKRYDVGPYEGIAYRLTEIDEDGLIKFNEIFAENKLGDAIIRLLERYTESLPEGAEKRRASGMVELCQLGSGRADFDRLVACMAGDAQLFDHRTAGIGHLSGAEKILEAFRVFAVELTDEYTQEFLELGGLQNGALLILDKNTGIDCRTGGAFERIFWDLLLFDDDGKINHWERFNEDKREEALARFEELTGDTKPEPVKRIVQPNLATEATKHALKAIVERNWEAARAYLHDDLVETDHTNGASIGPDQMMSSVQLLFHGDNPVYDIEPLATLGPHLMLALRKISSSGAKGKRFDVGEYANTTLHLAEFDDESRMCHAEVFAENKLGEAVIRLYERYAESLPEGAERTRAFGIAEIKKAYLGPIDYERFVPCLAPDVLQHDHRHVGSGTLSGADDVADATRVTVIELTENITGTLDGLLGLRPEGSLFHFTNTGTLRNSGGEFERNTWELLLHDDAGLLSHWERFDSKDAGKALARFDELTSDTAATPKPAPDRRVTPNATTKVMKRWDVAVAKQDWTAARQLTHDDFIEIDHANGTSYGPDALISRIESLTRSDDPWARNDPIATLGDKLGLFHRYWGASGAQGKRYEVGAYEYGVLMVFETDEHGRSLGSELFAENKLGEALVRLYERYAEQLPEGRERQKWLRLAEGMSHANGKLDIDRMAANFAPDLQMVDHRVVGVGTLQGSEAVSNALNMIVTELAENVAGHIDDVRGVHPNAQLFLLTTTGTDRRSGGVFERQIWELMVSDDDGMLVHWERFEPEHLDRSLARFDELTADTPPVAVQQSASPNTPTDFLARVLTAMKTQDWAGLRATYSDDYVEVHHPTGSTFGPDQSVKSIKANLESENGYHEITQIATLGTRLFLNRMHAGASGKTSKRYDIGPYEHRFVSVVQTNDQGLNNRHEVFAEEKLGDALVRIYELYAESLPEGPERDRAGEVAASITAMLTPFTMDIVEPRLAADMAFTDNRLLGSWNGSGKDEVAKHTQGLHEVADNIQVYDEEVLATEPNLLLIRRMHAGIERVGGGDYERLFLILMGFNEDGMTDRWEFFDVGDEAKALARFDELTADTQAVPAQHQVQGNAASVMVERADKLFKAGDWDSFMPNASDDYIEIHHPTGSSYGREETAKTMNRLLRAQDPFYQHTLLATLGPRLCLCKGHFGASGDKSQKYDVGPFESVFISIWEVNQQGDVCRAEVFADNKLGDALVRIYELYAESLPEGPERDCASRIASTMTMFNGPVDIKHMPKTAAPSYKCVDHRIYGTWTSDSVEKHLLQFSAQLELVSDFACRLDEVIELTPQATCLRFTYYGTDRASGGLFENCFCGIQVWDANGQISVTEVFEREDIDKARARFKELTAESGDETDTEPFEPPQDKNTDYFSNAATKAHAAFVKCYMDKDWDSAHLILAEDVRISDRRRLLMVETEGRDKYLEYFRALGDLPNTKVTARLLATRGERLTLSYDTLVVSGDDVGESEVHILDLFCINENGEIDQIIRFSPEDIDAAYAELDRRYYAGEAKDRKANQQQFREAIAKRDWEAIKALAAPEFVEDDHRSLAVLGTRHGPENWAETLKALIDLAPDTQIRLDHIRLNPDCSLNHATFHGTQDGGYYEMPFITVARYNADGLIMHHDLYEPEQIDEAIARFEKLASAAA